MSREASIRSRKRKIALKKRNAEFALLHIQMFARALQLRAIMQQPIPKGDIEAKKAKMMAIIDHVTESAGLINHKLNTLAKSETG